MQSPPRTPNQPITTTDDLFAGDSTPTLPRERMYITDIHRRLDVVYPDHQTLEASDDPKENEKYMKLVYAVAKGMFNPRDMAKMKCFFNYQAMAKNLIDETSDIGKHFHALYSKYDEYNRKWTMAENQFSEHKIEDYESYVVNYQWLPGVSNLREDDPDRVFELFRDSNHPNLKPFYRIQDHQNCFANSGIGLHFYLQLFHDETLSFEDAQAVDLSCFLRNQYKGRRLLDYIVNGQGDSFQSVLNKLIRRPDLLEDFGNMTFDAYVETLKKHGPAVVSMSVGADFKAANKYYYKNEAPVHPKPGDEGYVDKVMAFEGHGMLLEGVVNCSPWSIQKSSKSMNH